MQHIVSARGMSTKCYDNFKNEHRKQYPSSVSYLAEHNHFKIFFH